MSYCQSCGAKIRENLKFCEQCGHPVSDGDTAPAKAPAVMPEPVASSPVTPAPAIASRKKGPTLTQRLGQVRRFVTTLVSTVVAIGAAVAGAWMWWQHYRGQPGEGGEAGAPPAAATTTASAPAQAPATAPGTTPAPAPAPAAPPAQDTPVASTPASAATPAPTPTSTAAPAPAAPTPMPTTPAPATASASLILANGDFEGAATAPAEGSPPVIVDDPAQPGNHVAVIRGPDEIGFGLPLPAAGAVPPSISVSLRVFVPGDTSLITFEDGSLPDGLRFRVRLMNAAGSTAIRDSYLRPIDEWTDLTIIFDDPPDTLSELLVEAIWMNGPIYVDDVTVK